jgi:hypothetical protein
MKGWKLLREDGMSLNGQHRYRVDGTWETVPGAGAAVAITGGLRSAGVGQLLVRVECDPGSECVKPPVRVKGVRWYRRIRTRRPTPADLARAVREDPSREVRLAAAERLTDPAELARAARMDPDWYVRATAVERLTDPGELARAARMDEDWRVRLAAIKRLAYLVAAGRGMSGGV